MKITEEIIRGYREFQQMIAEDRPESTCSQDYFTFINNKEQWVRDGTYVTMLTMLRQLVIRDDVREYVKSLFPGASRVPNQCSVNAALPMRDAGNPARFMITDNIDYACKWFGTRVMNSGTVRHMFKRPGYISGKTIDPDCKFEDEENPFYKNHCVIVDFRSYSAGDSTRSLEYKIDCAISWFVEAHGVEERDATLLILIGDNRVWDEQAKRRVVKKLNTLSVYNVLTAPYAGDLAMYPRYADEMTTQNTKLSSPAVKLSSVTPSCNNASDKKHGGFGKF